MQTIIPHLWFDKEAVAAAEFYASAFGKGSHIQYTNRLENTPSGTVEIVGFKLLDLEFHAISAGPLFRFNPSISFFVNCETADEVDALWDKLLPGGMALMELGAYPFSEHYGWLQDAFGLSWQLAYSANSQAAARIVPMLLFVGDVCGKAQEAIDLYTSIFPAGKVEHIQRYGKDEEPDQEGTLKYAEFSLAGQRFALMDSAYAHAFAFNEAISLMVNCDTQAEIDHYWDNLSAVPEAEQCGWLKDRFGLSWQIVPAALDAMMRQGSQAQIARVTEAFLQMKKFDLDRLQRAFAGG